MFPQVTAWINFTLFAIFGSRSVWNFLTGANFVVIYVNQTSVLDSVWTVLIYSVQYFLVARSSIVL